MSQNEIIIDAFNIKIKNVINSFSVIDLQVLFCETRSGIIRFNVFCAKGILSNYQTFYYFPSFQKKVVPQSGFHPNTFVYSRFSSRIQFFYYLLNSLSPSGSPMVGMKVKLFQIQVSSSLENAFPRLRLTAEAQLIYRMSTVVVRFLGILEFYGGFRRKVDQKSQVEEIEIFNLIQD